MKMISEGNYEEIKTKLEGIVDEILDDNPQFAEVKEVKTAIEWYKKTRDGKLEPTKILEVINKLILSRLSETMPSKLVSSLEEKLDGLEIQKSSSGISIKKPLLGAKIEVDITLVANETANLGKITVGLQLDVDFALEKMKSFEKEGKKYLEIKSIAFSCILTIFSKMILRTKSIQLGKQKNFVLENVIFSLD